MPVITLINEEKQIDVPEGMNLRKALLKNGVNPYTGKDKWLNCRGNGLCGTCRVEIVDAKSVPPMSPLEEAALIGLSPFFARTIPRNTRLSCRLTVTGDMTIKTHPHVELDRQLTKERLILTAIWTFFGGIFLLVIILLILDMTKVL